MTQPAVGHDIHLPDTFNVASYFLESQLQKGQGDSVAIRVGEQTTTYKQLDDLSNQVGNACLNQGTNLENRVALLLLDSVEFAAAFLGTIKIGAVPVPLSTMLRPADYLFLLNDSRAATIIAHGSLWEPLRPLSPQMKYLRHIIIVDGHRPPEVRFEDWIRPASAALMVAETSKDDSAFWLYTSGSTGFPKAAVHLQHDMVYCAELYAKGVLGMTEEDVTLSAAKLFFAYGLGNSLYFPLSVGGSAVCFPGRPLPESMFDTIHTHRPTLFFGVPTLYASMLQVSEAESRFDLSSLRLCVSAGEALPPEIYRRWKERFGLEILDGIGTTEILHIFLSNRSGKIRPGSSGQVVPGYEAKVVDDDGSPVPKGELGHLLVKGESTATHYWNRHEATKKSMVGEWIYTGDQVYQDEDDYFWYCGRSDDMLKVGGIWVSPVEVENTLMEHPSVLEGAVVGREDADQLVKPQAFIVLRPGIEGSPVLATELQEHVKGRLAPYKYPRWVDFVEELPKTPTGKIQRFKLRQNT